MAISLLSSWSDKLLYSCCNIQQRKSALTADDKSHLSAARQWNHCRGDEMWRLFRVFLCLFCKRRFRQRVGWTATCPRNELIVSRDAHMYVLDWLPVRNTKVHSGELRLGEASLRALFASLIKSYDCMRYLLTSSYATYTCDRWIRACHYIADPRPVSLLRASLKPAYNVGWH